MSLIHGKQMKIGDIAFFSPIEIVNGWASIDAPHGEVENCQWCSLHGYWKCPECWTGCQCGGCNYRADWDICFDMKRESGSYTKAVEFLGEKGFVIPLSFYMINNTPCHLDGHHRLTAALDLGFEVIPYQLSREWLSSSLDNTVYSYDGEELVKKLHSPVRPRHRLTKDLEYVKTRGTKPKVRSERRSSEKMGARVSIR